MAAGPVSHGNAQVLDPWRRVGGAQKVPVSTSFHVTMDSFSACSGGLETSDGCHQLSERAPGVAQPHAESLEARSSEKEGRRPGFSFEPERRSGLATADFSVRKSSL